MITPEMHTCHMLGCRIAIPEKLFACKQHWYMVPKPLRDAIWRTYRKGQEVTKTPSKEYVAAATAAIAAVALKERKGKTREEWLSFLESLPDAALMELQPQIDAIVAGAWQEEAPWPPWTLHQVQGRP